MKILKNITPSHPALVEISPAMNRTALKKQPQCVERTLIIQVRAWHGMMLAKSHATNVKVYKKRFFDEVKGFYNFVFFKKSAKCPIDMTSEYLSKWRNVCG